MPHKEKDQRKFVWQESSNSKHRKKFKHNKFDDKHRLPISRVKKCIVQKIKEYETVIVIGETGCGKTTQIPKYILHNNINKNSGIVVTQPRRVAAVSIANRVAEELDVEVGMTVGYKIRFENNTGPQTLLTFATDGTLLREAVDDELLSKYSVVILDEVHERTVTTDILFGAVKSAQIARKNTDNPLKLIVMSAAMDVDHFKEYFDGAPVLYVEGRNHKVDIYFTTKDADDYYRTCLVTVFNIHTDVPANEDILVFLTGQEEIEKMAKDILTISKHPDCVGPPILVYTLYASSDPKGQLEIFKPTPPSMRKVILSTNIAETSLTIPGIKYVIDSGKVKMKFHNPITGVDILKVVSISHEQAIQRSGRAGRESDGVCYRAYSIEQYEKLSPRIVPEIRRCNLSSVTLNLLAMKKNPRTFDFIDKPEEAAIIESLHELYDLGAISEVNSPNLTDCGMKMALLPLDPKYSKLLLNAAKFSCLDEIIDIIAMLSSDNIFINFYSTKKEDENPNEIRKKFHNVGGDLITYINIYRKFNRAKSKKEWCEQNYLNYRALDFAQRVKKQLMSYCNTFGFHVTNCGPEFDSVLDCLVTGLFNNVAIRQSDGSFLTLISKQRAFVHPSSMYHSYPPSCVLFTELVESSELYMKNITCIHHRSLANLVPNHISKKHLYDEASKLPL